MGKKQDVCWEGEVGLPFKSSTTSSVKLPHGGPNRLAELGVQAFMGGQNGGS